MSPRQTYRFLTGTAAGLVAGALGVYLLVGGARPTNTVTFNTEQSYEYMGRIDEARAARTYIAATEGSRISGTVQISANLAPYATPDTTLFIYATEVNSPGPPLAVLRLRVERWPVPFVLDDADAMIPGRNLSASKSVQLEARVSPSGAALPRPGDLVGTVTNVDPQTTHSVNISIDRQVT
jgi:cytochrome c-type biogenesis protein CcmH